MICYCLYVFTIQGLFNVNIAYRETLKTFFIVYGLVSVREHTIASILSKTFVQYPRSHLKFKLLGIFFPFSS